MFVYTKRRASLGTLPACGGAAELAVAFQGFERLLQSLVLDAQLFPGVRSRDASRSWRPAFAEPHSRFREPTTNSTALPP